MSDNKIIFFLTKLIDPAKREAYETWVREVDVPSVLAWPCTKNYRVVRLEGAVLDGVNVPSCDYIEIMEVTSLEGYQKAVADSPPSLFDQLRTHIGSFDATIGSVVK